MEVQNKQVVPVQSDCDRHIMQLVLDGNDKLALIQQCQLCLQVSTLDDVVNAKDSHLETWAYKGPGQGSCLK